MFREARLKGGRRRGAHGAGAKKAALQHFGDPSGYLNLITGRDRSAKVPISTLTRE
jgi:hypothetical protein